MDDISAYKMWNQQLIKDTVDHLYEIQEMVNASFFAIARTALEHGQSSCEWPKELTKAVKKLKFLSESLNRVKPEVITTTTSCVLCKA